MSTLGLSSGRTASATARTPVDCSELHQQPVDAALCPTFVHKLCYKLSSVVTFTFIQILDQNFVSFTEQRQSCRVCLIQHQKFALFLVSGLKEEKLIKKETYMKLKHANCIETSEYFCQISSKSIHITSSYTVSNLGRFFETQCILTHSAQKITKRAVLQGRSTHSNLKNYTKVHKKHHFNANLIYVGETSPFPCSFLQGRLHHINDGANAPWKK